MAGRDSRPRADRRSPGPAFLLPGAPQWIWGQRERGLLLGGSFASALLAGVFAWGTPAGALMLAFAYAAHVASTADAIRQWAFPGFGRWVPAASASAGLAAGYGPVVLLAVLLAWPGMEPGGARQGYLVNRLAYRDRAPGGGDHVWLAPAPGQRGGRLASVVGRPGDEVEWAGGRLRVAGRRVALEPFRQGQAPRSLAFRVPEGQLLVRYRTDDPFLPETWELVASARIEGHAWGKLYPVWERQFLN